MFRDAKLVQDFPTTIILKVNSRVGPAERASGPGHFKAPSGAAFHREQQVLTYLSASEKEARARHEEVDTSKEAGP